MFIAVINGELQRENKLISYEREFNILENDTVYHCDRLSRSRVIKHYSRVRESPNENLLTSEIFGNL